MILMVEAIFYLLQTFHKLLCIGVARKNDKRGISTAYVIDLTVSHEYRSVIEPACLREMPRVRPVILHR
jgi:hypothetical protein